MKTRHSSIVIRGRTWRSLVMVLFLRPFMTDDEGRLTNEEEED